MLKRTILFGAALLALAGCQKEQATPPSSTSPNNGLSAQASVPVFSPAISVSPDSLQTCEGTVATIHWDASKSGVTTDNTEIWVGPSESSAKLFAAGGMKGEAKTDAWTRPGTQFLLKNKLNGKVIGKTVVGGPACP